MNSILAAIAAAVAIVEDSDTPLPPVLQGLDQARAIVERSQWREAPPILPGHYWAWPEGADSPVLVQVKIDRRGDRLFSLASGHWQNLHRLEPGSVIWAGPLDIGDPPCVKTNQD